MDQNSVVIVTGANAGVGKATCIALAKTGATVVMLCRDRGRGEKAMAEIREASQNDKIDLMICDLGKKESIEAFCKAFMQKYQRLDVLINNAGVLRLGSYRTADGDELHFGVNHLGHFLLTNRLLGLMIKSAPARIINVSSCVHRLGVARFDDDPEKNNAIWRGYAQSKLANILFTRELSDRLKGTGVTVNCLHPGIVATDIVVNRITGFGKLVARLQCLVCIPADKGAQTSVYLALSPEVESVTGGYFCRSKAIRPSKKAYDKDAAKKLWAISENMTGLNKDDNAAI